MSDSSDDSLESLGDADAANLLYSCSHTFVKPSKDTSISGYLSLLHRANSVYVGWVPKYQIDENEDHDSYVVVDEGSTEEPLVHMSALFGSNERSSFEFLFPLESLHSIAIDRPKLSNWMDGSLTFNLFESVSHLPVYFSDAADAGQEGSWGGQVFLRRLEAFAVVVYSRLNPKLVLVNPSKIDTEAHQSESPFPDDLDNVPSAASDDLSLAIFTPLSRVTRGARSAFNKVAQATATSLTTHATLGPLLRQTAPDQHEFLRKVAGIDALQSHSGLGEFDPHHLQLARWAQIIAEEGERSRKAETTLGSPNIEAGLEQSSMGPFEIIASSSTVHHLDPVRSTKDTKDYKTFHKEPLSLPTWESLFSQRSGKLKAPLADVKRLVFTHGLAPETRPHAWPFLLGVYSWESTAADRRAALDEITASYAALQHKYLEARTTSRKFAEELHRIRIDCRRTDRRHPLFVEGSARAQEHLQDLETILLTYVFAEPTRNYVQGMSDLLSPVYAVCHPHLPLVFACFSKYMDKMAPNFSADQNGIHTQLTQLKHLLAVMDQPLFRHFEATGSLNLFFCFRWLLCNFKRELSFDDTLLLWDVLWSQHLGPDFHVFVALSILEKHRRILIRYLHNFDEILKYVNDLSGHLNITEIIDDAEIFYLSFAQLYNAAPSIDVSTNSPNATHSFNFFSSPYQGSIKGDPYLMMLMQGSAS